MRPVTRNMLLGLAAFVVASAVTLLALREPTEELTAAKLSDARDRWRNADINSYQSTYRMNGAAYAIEVHGGIVVSARVDGRDARSSALHSYSVPGIFDTLELELENLADPRGPFAGRQGTILMRVRFNDEHGYVERYLRSAGGVGRGAAIELLSFRPLKKGETPPPNPPTSPD